MNQARSGTDHVFLSETFSFQAPQFYRSLGYHAAAEIGGFPHAAEAEAMSTETEVRAVLKRMLANGPLTALPTRPRDLEVLLGLAALQFEPKRSYSEPEVNERLQAWLEPFSSPFGVDHVTVRRCLVDAGLLKRDKAGATYELAARRRSPRIDVEPAQVMADVQLERAKRKRTHLAAEKR